MPNVKITQLTPQGQTDVTGDDVLPIVDAPGGGVPVTKKVTISDLLTQAPVQSVAGKQGALTLSSQDLTDGANLGLIQSVNGQTGAVSLASGNLSNSTDIALLSNLGTHSDFVTQFNLSLQ